MTPQLNLVSNITSSPAGIQLVLMTCEGNVNSDYH